MDDTLKSNIERCNGVVYYLTPETWVAHIPSFLIPTKEQYSSVWNRHPSEFHKIKIAGKETEIPRWQQAYGKSYNYSGAMIEAAEPDELISNLISLMNVLVGSEMFNMCLCNWYKPEHYIGKHSDDTKQLVINSPIASISWGYTRTFVLTPKEKGETLSLDLNNGDLVIMGGTCQQTHKHEIKKISEKKQSSADTRINFTFRCFKTE